MLQISQLLLFYTEKIQNKARPPLRGHRLRVYKLMRLRKVQRTNSALNRP